MYRHNGNMFNLMEDWKNHFVLQKYFKMILKIFPQYMQSKVLQKNLKITQAMWFKLTADASKYMLLFVKVQIHS